MSFEHHNICGLNKSMAGSVTSRNFLNSQDDLSFKFEYTHPYLDGLEDRSRNCTFKTSCFNTRKLSPVFAAGPNMADAPPIWVDRVGIKANIAEANLSRDNTEFINGMTISDRCIFQLDKGLGIGSKNLFFNHHQLTVTKFVNLNKQKNGAGKPPPAGLIAHGRYV